MKKLLRLLAYLFAGLLIIVFAYMVVNYHADIPVDDLKAKYTNSSSKFMDLDQMKVHYRDEGNAADSIPLVLIHGTASSLHTWDAWVETLKTEHRIIRLDLPAFGLTGPNPQDDYSLTYYSKFLHDFLEKLGVKHYALAGNSLGGSIVWHHALDYPDQVSKLILIDAGGYSTKGKLSGGAAGFKIAKIPILNKLVSIITPKSIIRKSLLDTYGQDSLVTDQLVDRYFDMLLRAGNRDAVVKRFAAVFKADSHRIKTIKTPTLILWGDLDQLIPVEHAELFHQDLPNDTLVILKGIGHVPMEEAPKASADAVRAFLKKK
jgi:pimeloyl-ACP methyl ester carboxylesterase